MSFIFTMRSTPVASMHHRSTSSLPVIDEDEALPSPAARSYEPITPPAVPPRAWNRPSHKHFGLGTPPGFHSEGSPPAYNRFDAEGVQGPNGEKLADVRRKLALGVGENKHIAKRGGWRRILLLAIIFIVCAIGVGVGVALGLKHRKSSTSNASPSNHPSGPEGGTSPPSGGASGTVPSSSNPTTNTTFPAGSYSIATFLDTVSTNCTSAPSTWTCYPYNTYAQSRTQSTAVFDWIITPVAGTSENFTISSTQNYFSIVFANASLELLNKGADNEHYFFQTTLQKPTKPAGQLGSSTAQATCYFNSTTFQAYLYTKLPKTFPAGSANTTSPSQPYAPWPYAVKVEQVVGAGAGTPDCVDPSGKSMGDFSVQDGTQLCDCLYLNTGT